MSIKVSRIIGVVGTKEFNSHFPYEEIAEQIGEEVAREGYWLLCGGTTGVMEAAPRGAQRLRGITIGILPKAIAQINDENKSTEWPSSHIDVAIFTGLGGGIKGRNQVIVNSCDAIIGLPGSNKTNSGTRSEIDFAIRNRVPVVLHKYWQTVTTPEPIKEAVPMIQYFDTSKDAVEKAKRAIEHRATETKLTTSRR